MYNPHRVTRIERQAFQLIGDKVQIKVQRREAMTESERNNYWESAIRKAMSEVNRATN